MIIGNHFASKYIFSNELVVGHTETLLTQVKLRHFSHKMTFNKSSTAANKLQWPKACKFVLIQVVVFYWCNYLPHFLKNCINLSFLAIAAMIIYFLIFKKKFEVYLRLRSFVFNVITQSTLLERNLVFFCVFRNLTRYDERVTLANIFIRKLFQK